MEATNEDANNEEANDWEANDWEGNDEQVSDAEAKNVEGIERIDGDVRDDLSSLTKICNSTTQVW